MNVPVKELTTGPQPIKVHRVPRLSAADRCDSCGAQAYVRVTLRTGPLLFCAHHSKKYQDKLSAVALEWLDERWQLEEIN